MVKLYYTPTSCGAASFIVAHAAGLNIECEEVNLGTHQTASGKVRHARDVSSARCFRSRGGPGCCTRMSINFRGTAEVPR